MPSALVNNTNVEFICARDFTYDKVDYKMGQEFDQNLAIGRIELLVRTRRIIPVVENSSVKPRMFHREVRIKQYVLDKLGVSEQPQSFSRMANAPAEQPVDWTEGEYNPGDHKVDEVLEYVDQHPDEILSVYELEEQGKNRPTLLSKLDDILNQEEVDV